MIDINNQIVNTKGCQYHIEGSEKLYSAEFVMQAIKEKEEREKGCVLCKSYEKSLMDASIQVGVITSSPINYCPYCGKKLGE